jgi:hypothetical protein
LTVESSHLRSGALSLDRLAEARNINKIVYAD